MRAIVKTEPGIGATFTEMPVPQIGDDEVLIKVLGTSICGSDLHLYNWDKWAASRVHLPRIMGHELAGEIVEVGKRVRSLKPGDYVSTETHIYCGHCYACKHGRTEVCQNLQIVGFDRDGVFAEYVALPEKVVWKNDPSIPKEWASIQEPLGNAIDTALAEDPAGKTVLVTGCGPVGLLAIGVVRAAGATTIFATDINEYRLNLALQMGASFVLNPKKVDVVEYVKDATHGAGVEILLEMSGNQRALQDGLKCVTPGGAAALLGIFPQEQVSFNLNDDVILKGVRVHGITGRKIFSTWYKSTQLLSSGRLNLDPVITHRFPMAEFERGIQLMKEGLCGKVLLTIP
ncbi:MAG TPA: L-threonine 3-dehydrogenase [Bacteroidetes bacterium]|nr:L-threonine 3-dehydrogenase [Bacteroidota bacterium]